MQKFRSTVRLSGTIHFVGALFALYVLGWICGCVDSIWGSFQMLDVDDSGTIEVGEYRKAVREYGGFSKEKISDGELSVTFKAFDLDGDGEISEREFMVLWAYTLARMRDPKHAEQNMKKEVHKVAEHVNKKEKDEEAKEKRKLHVRAIAELDLNASIHQAIEENEERIAEMVEKQEEEVAHHAVEAGQSIDGTENVQNDENMGDETHTPEQ